MTDLKPCPFCNGTPRIVHTSHGGRDQMDELIGVQCTNCQTTIWMRFYDEKDVDRIIEKWNGRVKE